MKKLIIGFVILAIFVLLLMPYITGRVAESTTLQLAAQINQNYPEYGELTVLDYQRGIRSTQSGFSWKPSQLSKAQFKPQIVFRCDGNHGVFSYSYDCQLENAERYTEFVDQLLDGIDPLTISGSVNVLGDISHSIHLDAIDVDKNGEVIRVLPAFISVVSDKKLATFAIKGEFRGVEVKGSDGSLMVGLATLSGKVRQNSLDLAIGDVELAIKAITLESEVQGRIEISHLTLHTDAQELGENLGVRYRLALKQFKQTGVAADLDLSNLIMNFQMAGIDMLQMSTLNEKLDALGDQPQSAQNASLLALLPAFESLLKPGLKLEFQLSADHLSEPVAADLAINLTNNLTLGDFLLFSVNPRNLFTKVDVQLTNQLPLSFIDKSPSLYGAMTLSPWHIKSTQGYATDFRIASGSIKLNGKELEINEFLAMLGIKARKTGWGRGL
jgi:hypothetical protein